jgi:hypothetical protein
MRPGDWVNDGACLGVDPLVFELPVVDGGRLTGEQLRAAQPALNVCGSCPVVADCREYADRSAVWGVVQGGEIRLSYDEAIRARQNRARAGRRPSRRAA